MTTHATPPPGTGPQVRPVTRNGRTHYVDHKPKPPPLTLDEKVLRAVAAATAVVVAGALVWSTVSIGDMLSVVAPAWAAYMIAAIFDLTWVVAMAAEYLLRFEPARQKVPKGVGWVALVVSMAAIFTDGALLGAHWIGLFGALVSALAKSLWWLVMYVTGRSLDADTQAWLTLELGEVHARRAEQLAVAKVNRERERYALDQVDRPAELAPVHAVQSAVQAPDQRVNQIEPVTEPAPVHVVQSAVRSTVQPQSADGQVDELLKHLRRGEHLTKARAAGILGVPESTAYRRLLKATSVLNQYN